jgi:hypothetical protein
MKPTSTAITLMIVLLSCTMIHIFCKKGGTANQPLQPIATEPGTPDGTAIAKNIGSAGGTVVSADSMMELVIPAGALSTNTAISIQPITNTVPGGTGKGYRCLPDGQQFAKDITLKIRYTASDLAATDFNCMGIAFQNADRYWQVVNGFTNDSIAKVISVPVNHFTDYTIFHLFDIVPAERSLKPNASGTFKIDFDAFLLTRSETVQLITLAGDLEDHPVVWKANGVVNGNATHGTIRGDFPDATYTAPASAPSQNPVSISADINLPFTLAGKHFNKVTLVAYAHIRAAYKFSLRYEFSGTDACGQNGQNEFDVAEMQVHVNDTTVTFSNFVNQAPTAIQPASIAVDIDCTLTAVAGATGQINIVSGTGEVIKGTGGNEDWLFLHIKNSGATSNSCSVKCPNQPDATIVSHTWADVNLVLAFTLKDSLQTLGSKPGNFATLKPIP